MKTNGWACKREKKGEVLKMGVCLRMQARGNVANIVLFGLSLSGFPSRFLKHVC